MQIRSNAPYYQNQVYEKKNDGVNFGSVNFYLVSDEVKNQCLEYAREQEHIVLCPIRDYIKKSLKKQLEGMYGTISKVYGTMAETSICYMKELDKICPGFFNGTLTPTPNSVIRSATMIKSFDHFKEVLNEIALSKQEIWF